MTININNSSWKSIKKIKSFDKQKMLSDIINSKTETIPVVCNFWMCWACLCKVKKGIKNLEKNSSEYPLEKDEILTCISKIKNEKEDIILELKY